MKTQDLFFARERRLRAIWRIPIFICALLLGFSPLFLFNNSYLQFLGAVFVLTGGLYLNSKYLDKIDFSAYGLVFNKETFVQLIVGLLIGFLSVVVIFFIGSFTDILLITKAKPVFSVSVLLFAFKMLCVGMLEETFFRGYLFTTIYDGFRSKKIHRKQALWIALLVSSLIFGLAHLSTSHASFLSTLFLSLNGMVWCIPFIITKNLGLSIGLHTSWNFTQTQIGFTMSGNKAINSFYNIKNIGPAWLTGGEYGPEAGVLGLIGFLMMLLMLLSYLFFSRKNKKIA